MIEHKIRNGSVTAEDFNQLIAEHYQPITELSTKSVRERMRRLGDPVDANRMHDSEGHSRVTGPQNTARLAPRKGGGKLNDPRRTARGRGMLRRQATKSESVQANYREAIGFIQEHHGKEYELSGLKRPELLHRLVLRLLREDSPLDRDWLFQLHRKLEKP